MAYAIWLSEEQRENLTWRRGRRITAWLEGDYSDGLLGVRRVNHPNSGASRTPLLFSPN